jgi:hypothetical protein
MECLTLPPPYAILKDLFIPAPFMWNSKSDCKMYEKVTPPLPHTNTIYTDRASITARHGRGAIFSNWEFETTVSKGADGQNRESRI